MRSRMWKMADHLKRNLTIDLPAVAAIFRPDETALHQLWIAAHDTFKQLQRESFSGLDSKFEETQTGKIHAQVSECKRLTDQDLRKPNEVPGEISYDLHTNTTTRVFDSDHLTYTSVYRWSSRLNITITNSRGVNIYEEELSPCPGETLAKFIGFPHNTVAYTTPNFRVKTRRDWNHHPTIMMHVKNSEGALLYLGHFTERQRSREEFVDGPHKLTWQFGLVTRNMILDETYQPPEDGEPEVYKLCWNPSQGMDGPSEILYFYNITN
ncbi:hypothetical protein M231_01431 [Tremella mesenterica]|uniref:Uncharacterized protein n=1 Tax=Tremella mesenterica TaxID=5217 RepID=A0A4Q1BT95_TREME|nr:hypothetical protein M231_01431 [Tremella mesenterica]